jgi:hypothetical protein
MKRLHLSLAVLNFVLAIIGFYIGKYWSASLALVLSLTMYLEWLDRKW